MPHRPQLLKALALVPIAAFVLSCGGALTFDDVFFAKAPDGRREVRVSEAACFADCVVRVSVVSERGKRDLAVKGDGYVDFVEAAWSPDSRTVSVFVHLLFRSGLLTGYDFEKQSLLPEEIIRPRLEAALRTRYSLPPDFLLPFQGDLDRWSYEVGRYKFDMASFVKTKKPIILPYVQVEDSAR